MGRRATDRRNKAIAPYKLKPRSIVFRLYFQWRHAGNRPPLVKLDAAAQIRLFEKLKLTKCAPVTGLPETGFFMRAQAG
jgi:hypothetical protein